MFWFVACSGHLTGTNSVGGKMFKLNEQLHAFNLNLNNMHRVQNIKFVGGDL
jgi:hypothetical protein